MSRIVNQSKQAVVLMTCSPGDHAASVRAASWYALEAAQRHSRLWLAGRVLCVSSVACRCPELWAQRVPALDEASSMKLLQGTLSRWRVSPPQILFLSVGGCTRNTKHIGIRWTAVCGSPHSQKHFVAPLRPPSSFCKALIVLPACYYKCASSTSKKHTF